MTEECAPKRLVNERLAGTAYVTMPVKYLEMAEQLYPSFLGSEGVFRFNHPLSNHLELCASDFYGQLQLGSLQHEVPSCIPNDAHNRSLNVDNDSLVSYQQRWESEIANRFREAKKRFPEFFPCFELLEIPGKGLQYSIHFEPLTEHAKELSEQTPLFPRHKEFKPIEKLWHSDGSSELDILFERFPTQLALLPPKQPWETRWWQLLLGLVHQTLELRHIRSLLARKA